MRWMLVTAALALTSGCGPNAPATRRVDPTKPLPHAADAPRYDAGPADGVQFWKPGLPLFLADLTGVSGHEVWGRWTDGPLAVLTFVEPLPARFTLAVTAAAYGPNVGRPSAFTAGTVTRTSVFGVALGNGPPEIRPYQPARPYNGDERMLGLALVRLQIEPD